MPRHPPSGGRRAMDFAHRSPVDRTAARQISAVPDLPPPFPALGAGRHAGQGIADAGRRPVGARGIGFGRDFHRRLLQRGQEGAVQLVQHAAAKGPRSWQLRTAVVFLSPWGLQALRLMKRGRRTYCRTALHHGDARMHDWRPRLRQRSAGYPPPNSSTASIEPHKSNRSRPRTQDGRKLRRYCRRWKIERLFAWLHDFRRLVPPLGVYEANFLGLIQLACILILLRNHL